MKKYLFTMAVMAVFAIGFTASDDDSSSSTDSQKKEQRYRESKGRCINMAYAGGEVAAEEGANDLLRQGYTKSDLEGIAGQQARLEYKTIDKCCRVEYFEENYKEFFTTEEQEKFRQQCIEAYIKGYMDTLGKTIFK